MSIEDTVNKFYIKEMVLFIWGKLNVDLRAKLLAMVLRKFLICQLNGIICDERDHALSRFLYSFKVQYLVT